MENYLQLNSLQFKKYIIYDIFFTEKILKLIIRKKKLLPDIHYKGQKPKILTGRGRHLEMVIYTFSMPTYEKEITIKINGIDTNVSVNKYIDVKNEIIMSTVTKDQDNYLIPWIEYYKHMGVTKFMIYDNSSRKSLGRVLEKYINDKTVVLFDFGNNNIPYRVGSRLLAQPLQQNHSLHAFKNAKYIGMFDIDEYLNPQKKEFTSLPGMFDDLLKMNNKSYKKLAGFSFQNRFFYNSDGKKDTNFRHLGIGYSANYVTGRFRKKMFINPSNVNYFTIHTLSSYHGTDLFINENLCFFNHYRYIGYNAKKKGGPRGRKDLSILRHLQWLDKDVLVDKETPTEIKARKKQMKNARKQIEENKTKNTKSAKKRRKMLRKKKKD